MSGPDLSYGEWVTVQLDGAPHLADEMAEDASRVEHEVHGHGCTQCLWDAFGERPQHAPGTCTVCDDLRAYAAVLGVEEDDD